MNFCRFYFCLSGWFFLLCSQHAALAFTTNDANTLFSSYNSAFYTVSGTNGYFNNTQTSGGFNVWEAAEEIECVEDAYQWTSNAMYAAMITNLLNGYVYTLGPLWTGNGYNDDILWGVIAFARGGQLTGITNYSNIAKNNFDAVYARAWDTNLGGGLYWEYPGNFSKNACVNGPGACAAYLLYQTFGDINYFNKATNIYYWERSVLYNSATGRVYDNINTNGTVDQTPTTYNQGTFIGIADFLGLTSDAAAAVNYTMNSMTTGGILPQYGIAQNNSGFNAIFLRWAARYMRNHNLQSTYQAWLQFNANAAWNLRRGSDGLSWCQWLEPTPGLTNFYSWDCISSVEALQAAGPTQSTAPGIATLLASDTTGNSSFVAAGNWSTGVAPGWTNNYLVNGLNLLTPADSSTHNFQGSSLILTNSGGLRLTTSGAAVITVGTSLAINNGIVSAWTLPANLNGVITLQSGGGVFDPQSLGNFVINSSISGPGSLTVATDNDKFSGTVLLAGINTYTGGTIINGPDSLCLTNYGSLGSTNGSLTFNNNGNGLTITHSAYTTANYGNFNLNSFSVSVGNLSGGGGRIFNNGGSGIATFTIGSGNNGGGTFQGTIVDHTSGTGTVALVKTGSGAITLSGNGNTCSGGLTVNGGTLAVTGSGSLATTGGVSTAMSLGSGNFSSGTLSGTLDVSSASNFTANVGSIQVGVNAATSGTVSGSAGVLYLGTNNSLAAASSFLLGDSAGAFNTTVQLATTAAGGWTSIQTPVLTVGGRKANSLFALGTGATLSLGNAANRTALGVGNAAPFGQIATGTTFAATNDLSAGIFSGYLSSLVLGTINNSGAGGETGTMILGANPANHLNLSGAGNVVLLGTNSAAGTGLASGILSVSNLDSTSAIASTDNSTAILLGASLRSAGVLNLGGGTLTITTTGSAIAGGAGTSTVNFNGVTLRAGASSASFITNLTAAALGANGITLDTAGYNISVGQMLSGAGGLTKIDAGQLTLSKANTFTGSTIISAGTLVLSGQGSISASSKIAVSAGATLDVSGVAGQTLNLVGGQTLTGSGSLTGNLNASSGSTIMPGDTIGAFTASGNVALAGIVVLGLNRTNAPANDQLAASGGIAGGGTLTVTNLGPTPQAGDVYPLFNQPVSGFATLNLPTLPVGTAWLNKIATDGTLRVVATTPVMLGAQTSGASLSFSWPADHVGWKFEMQTNGLNAGLGTNWTEVPGSDTNDQITVPIIPGSGSAFFRLVSP
jgi:autotransporter-associated beta strand protein